MAEWKKLFKKPAGALPANMARNAGIVFVTVVIAGLVLSTMWSDNAGETVDDLLSSEPILTGEGQVAQLATRLTDLQDEQQRAQARAVEETERLRREAEASQAIAGLLTPDSGTMAAAGVGGGGPGLAGASAGGPGAFVTPDEVELRERLRLEGLERRARSLRTPAMVQTSRVAPTTGAVSPVAAQAGTGTRGAAAPAPTAAQAVPAFDPLAMLDQITDAASVAGLNAAGGEDLSPWDRTVPGVTGPPIEGSAEPVTMTTPTDPVGWERVYEGSVVSSVLVTQLSGDFAGPVEAQVSIPFYSSDRQRILIPRGARFLGTAQPVRDQDQSRLAVGFHRLIMPDGRWVNLAFHGLNGLGEGALLDQVNRHYVSMFAAAGAVGVIAGLTLQGSNPYSGGQQGFQAGAGQGLGQGASQILERFLNRLPSITIRAGHRLRIWMTGDFLMPRPAAHPERMFR